MNLSKLVEATQFEYSTDPSDPFYKSDHVHTYYSMDEVPANLEKTVKAVMKAAKSDFYYVREHPARFTVAIIGDFIGKEGLFKKIPKFVGGPLATKSQQGSPTTTGITFDKK